MQCGVWVDVGAVGVCFVYDESGDVGEDDEGVILGKGWDVNECSGLGEVVWGQGGGCDAR